ncbi:unnamed protein product [Trifolium pratense]|uniref:Uncharacterized protein n=1 Tax=Trifolium pratense TaxID=57577 RepID=A0ACB0K676_TRIPR|nr:unnamed protein product [Trifolium pratense]
MLLTKLYGHCLQLLEGTNIEVLAKKYVADWMIPYTTLKYIYVPIKDIFEHWYLMVISIKDHIVYHLDSCLQSENITHRIG